MKKVGRKPTTLMVGVALLLSCAFLAACARGVDDRADVRAALDQYRLDVDALRPRGAPRPDQEAGHALFGNALRLVLETYVTPSDPRRLVATAVEGYRAKRDGDPDASTRVLTEAAIDSMLAALDPYSAFLSTEHVRALRDEIYGDRASLDGEGPSTAGAIPKRSRLRPVTQRLAGDVAYIRIRQFNELTGAQVAEALESLRRQSRGRLAAAVLDLRDNPGGLVEQAVKVAEQFVGSAQIVSTRGHGVGTRHYFSGASADLLAGLPMAVLINDRSASAAEIVAGALQDYQRAVVFGTRSFGKGSVQTVYWLPGGEAVRLTTARYFRPSGAAVDCVGIAPNVEVRPAPSVAAGAAGRAGGSPYFGRPPCSIAISPPLETMPAAALCPEVAADAPDRPLDCALVALRTRRLSASVQTRAAAD
ncbi:S41 family peptidase [Azospirillum sp.]|uniref:S41 family peptidase n=1 Tax=Azospirillum sp. TaxID=34012 RepID=UPI003D743842